MMMDRSGFSQGQPAAGWCHPGRAFDERSAGDDGQGGARKVEEEQLRLGEARLQAILDNTTAVKGGTIDILPAAQGGVRVTLLLKAEDGG
jgi:hypothetical protein